MLNKNFMYTISDNCQLRTSAKGNIVNLFGRDVEEEFDMEVDDRMSLISFGSTKDLNEYFRYFFVVSSSAARRLASEEFMKGNFVAMLDNGYVPFYCAPTYMPKEFFDKFKDIVLNIGIPYIEEKPMRFDGLKVDSVSNDIWISRTAAAVYANCNLRDFKVLNFMKEVWSSASN